MPSNSNWGGPADVAIIGGGIIGCSIAMRLAQSGLKVTVLEKGKPGAEASSAAAGMIAPQGETTEPDAFFELCAASRDLYPNFISEVEQLTGNRLYYRRDGALLVAVNDQECSELEKVYGGQTMAGLQVEKLTGDEARGRVAGLSLEIRQALFVAGDHWVDNEQLAQALVRAGESAGVQFLSGAKVTRLNLNGARLESVETASNGRGASRFSAGSFVLAAGAWSSEIARTIGLPLPVAPCHGQMMEFESDSELPLVVRAGHHYLVPRSGRRIATGTTAEYVGHHKAVTAEGIQSILGGVARIAPFVKQMRFRRAWSGLRPDTADHLPVLGHGQIQNLVFATGHFRNGILLAPVTAKLIAELIVSGSPSRPLHAYSPDRFRAAPHLSS